MNPLDHFHLHGFADFRDPSPAFETKWYLTQNPDVRIAGLDPLLHYLRHGAAEGRAPSRRGVAGPNGGAARNRAAILPSVARRPPSQGLRRKTRRPRARIFDSVPAGQPIVLIIDSYFPSTDRDAGSLLMHHFVRLFQDLGYHVHYVAIASDRASSRYRTALASTGATLQDASTNQMPLIDLLENEGSRVSVALMSRVTVGGHFIEDILRNCHHARTIFETHDLHFLRAERTARLAGDRVGLFEAAALREMETYVARMSDVTLVVSTFEKALLEEVAPGARVRLFPLIHDAVGRKNGFASRAGLAFIGGYRHQPNIDALLYFLDEIWPLVRQSLPGVKFLAVGADMPEDLRRRDEEGFVAVGHVEDLAAFLDGVRLTVAPLRIGAGVKGKVISSLAHGVPCIVSPIAAEGIEALDSGTVLAADPRAFARAIVELHEDAAGWQAHSDAALRWVATNVSVRRARERLRDLLAELGSPLPPGEAAPEYHGDGAPVAIDGRGGARWS